MKATTKILAGSALILSMLGLNGCRVKEASAPVYEVYGPPPAVSDTAPPTELPDAPIPHDILAERLEKEMKKIVMVVYGPPPAVLDTAPPTELPDDPDPADIPEERLEKEAEKVIMAVYGPPPDFEDSDTSW